MLYFDVPCNTEQSWDRKHETLSYVVTVLLRRFCNGEVFKVIEKNCECHCWGVHACQRDERQQRQKTHARDVMSAAKQDRKINRAFMHLMEWAIYFSSTNLLVFPVTQDPNNMRNPPTKAGRGSTPSDNAYEPDMLEERKAPAAMPIHKNI